MSVQVKVKEVRLTKSLTLNLGNFESARIECGLTADINTKTGSAPSDQDVQDALFDLGTQIDQRLHTEMVELGVASDEENAGG